MPGLSQLKKFNKDILSLGDEITLRSARGEQPIKFPIPKDVEEKLLRFGRAAVPVINERDDYKFEIGKGNILKEGTDVTIIATGLMVNEALMAYEELKAEGISARVVNMATIKPIDRDLVIDSAKKTGVIVTAEEHNVIGGLGSAVAEVVCETVPVPVLRVGVEDTFGKSGPAVQLLHEFGLDAANIVAKCKQAVTLKK